jgi:DNA gyrase subunit B
MGKNDIIDLFKWVTHYKVTLKEIEKRYALPELIRHLIENPDQIGETNKELFKIIETYLEKLGYNILNKKVDSEAIHLFVQTNDGLEELLIDDELFSNPHYNEAIHIYKKIEDHVTDEFKDVDLLAELEKIEAAGKKGAYIQRYKGLGEMNPEQLWDTTMSPENRVLLQVKIDDFETASDVFTLFMGDEVEPRRNYIETHAKDVKHLDV